MLSQVPGKLCSLEGNVHIESINQLRTVDRGQHDSNALLGTVECQFFRFQRGELISFGMDNKSELAHHQPRAGNLDIPPGQNWTSDDH